MKHTPENPPSRGGSVSSRLWLRLSLGLAGLLALAWFLIRVIPKPSRAAYPCQRAAFPLASGLVLTAVSWFGAGLLFCRLKHVMRRNRPALAVLGVLAALVVLYSVTEYSSAAPEQPAEKREARFDWAPSARNQSVGQARGIHPGRVVFARDPLATRWAGNWKANSDQWWTDANTDQARVDALLSRELRALTGAPDDSAAWAALFKYHKARLGAADPAGYKPGQIVAIKINLNNCEAEDKLDNKIDASPQMVLALVRQLVTQAKVAPSDILIYDARRWAFPALVAKVWGEYRSVRFVQGNAPSEAQLRNPLFAGKLSGLEAADWVPGVEYSANNYNQACLIPRQVLEASYIVNLALLKAHSYPYQTMENGDSGQTAVTLCGKNHFGSIKGTSELHAAINTVQQGTKDAYSPIVDLAASPNLGGKTILFLLDGLYSGRKWRSYPQHFPNAPFNNRVEPYENPDWPACLLASLDPVAIDSVGIDILAAQAKNNGDPRINQASRLLIRENADDYLREMASPRQAPSGTQYRQGGKPVESLGVCEHWDSDETRRYSRNLDPVKGLGIELIELPSQESAAVKPFQSAPGMSAPQAPASLPGRGLAEHDFFYAGEAKEQRMHLVRGGKLVWSHLQPGRGEISDAVRLSNGNILFAHQYGITEIGAEGQPVWHYDAPEHTEIHTAQPIGMDRVLYVQNGDPAKVVVVNKVTGRIEREFTIPVANPKSPHGHFRHARLSPAGTLFVAHMDLRKVCEYDAQGHVLWSYDTPEGIWSAQPLANGNVLLTGGQQVREVTRTKKTVWQWKPSDTPAYVMSSLQLAYRLPNGNTLITNWFNQWSGTVDLSNPPLQAIEVTPERQVAWALRSWAAPAALGPATNIQILDTPETPEAVHFGDISAGSPAL